MDPIERLEQVKENARQKQLQISLQLPIWPEPKRAVPNEVVRSALFNIRNRRRKREYFKGAPVAVIGDGAITYTGEELRQDDEDVWMGVLHLARHEPLGEVVEFVPHAFLKMLGWQTGKREYQRLVETLDRLQATTIRFESRRMGGGQSVSLVRKFDWRDGTNASLPRWRVWIEPEISTLFGEKYYTQIEWQQRQKLNNMARWLHGYYASHAKPFPIKVATIKDGCGSETKDLWRFRATLRKALQELKEVGFLLSWVIDERDTVHVTRGRLRALAED